MKPIINFLAMLPALIFTISVVLLTFGLFVWFVFGGGFEHFINFMF